MIRFMTVLVFAFISFLPAPRTVEGQTSPAPMMDSVDPALLEGLQFRLVGPTQGGRVTAVTGVPSQPRTFYMGVASGGVFRTTDGGESWVPITDGQVPLGSVGDIAVAASDPNIIYLGTGSDGVRSNVSTGRGVYKTTDGGKTWDFVGLYDVGQIGAVRIHPTNPDIVWVAANGDVFKPTRERGIYKTTDGGRTWENTLFVSDSTGAMDVEIQPGNPDVLYAWMSRLERKPWTIISGSYEGGFYKSTDGGESWENIRNGLPTELIGKGNLGVTAAKPDRIYALIEAKPGGGMYRSDDYGESWQMVSDMPAMIQRPFYYTTLGTDPTNADVVYGGAGYEQQRQDLKDGVDILIGTPGRLIDYFKQKVFDLKALQVIVLDEADRMFDLGFIKDIRYLLRRMPPPDERLGMLFSATLSYRVTELAYEHMNNPQTIKIETDKVTADRVRQMAYMVANDEKVPLLIGLLRKLEATRTIVFVNTKRVADHVWGYLEGNGFHAAILSGDVPQNKRLSLLRKFQSGELPVLVATDVAARGLHIPDVTHVVNFDLPEDAEDYVHRIGRTARAGAEGDAISFVCETYAFSLPEIEDFIANKVPIEAVTDDLLAEIDPRSRVRRERPPRDDRRRGGGGRSSDRRGKPRREAGTESKSDGGAGKPRRRRRRPGGKPAGSTPPTADNS